MNATVSLLTQYHLKLLAILSLSVMFISCGGGGSSGSKNGPERFVVSPGLERSVVFADGQGELFLDEYALLEELELQVSVTDEQESAFSTAVTLAPVNTQLRTPSRLRMVLPEQVGADRRLVIARQEAKGWRPLLSSVVESGAVEASITELGRYAVVELEPLVVDGAIGPDCQAEEAQQELRFVHVADLHARYGTADQLFSRIKYYRDQVALESPYTIFTNGGDDFEKGSVAEINSEGAATVEATRLMAFDVRVVGNHDFAWGSDQLLAHTNDPQALVLSSNSLYRGEDEGYAGRDFVALQVGCLKVGFFGMTSVPWNELDEPLEDAPIPDFLPDVEMNWHWQQIAAGAVYQYRDQVDVLVMLSHLGRTLDTRLLQDNPGIDLALGGHSHQGVSAVELEGSRLVIQPDFYADGLTDIRLQYLLNNRQIASHDIQNIDVRSIAGVDDEVAVGINAIMARYAPDARLEIALSENFPVGNDIVDLAARAAMYHHNADAVMLAPNTVNEADRWLPGTLTQEDFHRAISVERQPSDTPGFTSFYSIEVTREELLQMQQAQAQWRVVEKDNPDSEFALKLVLQKGPAQNLSQFFPDLAARDATFLSEAWQSLDVYARHRTAECLHLDSDKRLNACEDDEKTTVWTSGGI